MNNETLTITPLIINLKVRKPVEWCKLWITSCQFEIPLVIIYSEPNLVVIHRTSLHHRPFIVVSPLLYEFSLCEGRPYLPPEYAIVYRVSTQWTRLVNSLNSTLNWSNWTYRIVERIQSHNNSSVMSNLDISWKTGSNTSACTWSTKPRIAHTYIRFTLPQNWKFWIKNFCLTGLSLAALIGLLHIVA